MVHPHHTMDVTSVNSSLFLLETKWVNRWQSKYVSLDFCELFIHFLVIFQTGKSHKVLSKSSHYFVRFQVITTVMKVWKCIFSWLLKWHRTNQIVQKTNKSKITFLFSRQSISIYIYISCYIKNPTWDLILLLISLQCPVAIYFSFSLRLSYILDKTGLSSTH